MKSNSPKEKSFKTGTITVDYLARVEGEGGVSVKVREGKVQEIQFRIFEPPRFFEAFLRGRNFGEAVDITARICGICPIAYIMSASHAMEDALGLKVEGPLRELRRLAYCGEWIESHVLHVALLHAPDFLGYESAIHMAKEHGDVVRTALELKRIGNEIGNLLGGREIHPINFRVGGFYRVPTKRDLTPLAEQLKWARDAALGLVVFTAGLPFPDFERDYEFVALRHPDEYPFNEGRIVSNKGVNIDVRNYEEHFLEEQVSHSTALHSVIHGRGSYFVGPLARFNLNFDRLSPTAQEAAREVGLTAPCNNPFKSIIVRAVETVYACDEALRIIENYEMPSEPVVPLEVRAGRGCGCTEAPRGILYHRYDIDEKGVIRQAKIVPPTSQNQNSIEEDVRNYVEQNVGMPKDKLTWAMRADDSKL